MNKKSSYIKSFLGFIMVLFFCGTLKAQNVYPTSKGSYIKIDGGGINHIAPVTTGGWARGLSFFNADMSARYFGMGIMGSGAVANRFYFGFGNGDPWTSQLGMHILSNGNIGIGTISPVARLTVNGNILAKEIKIKTDITVPDYVFENDYNLMTLSDIEQFVKEHKHLPEIPSGDSIGKNGLDLAEINLLLLKKIEELTLHLIEKEKELRLQGAQIHVLQQNMEKIHVNLGLLNEDE